MYSIAAHAARCDRADRLQAHRQRTDRDTRVGSAEAPATRFEQSTRCATANSRPGLTFRPQDTRAVELTDLARPALVKLRDRLQETTDLEVLDGAFVVQDVVVESPHIMRLAARVGERGHVRCTALGKAICATLAEDRV